MLAKLNLFKMQKNIALAFNDVINYLVILITFVFCKKYTVTMICCSAFIINTIIKQEQFLKRSEHK